jgi:hypothetical protein
VSWTKTRLAYQDKACGIRTLIAEKALPAPTGWSGTITYILADCRKGETLTKWLACQSEITCCELAIWCESSAAFLPTQIQLSLPKIAYK